MTRHAERVDRQEIIHQPADDEVKDTNAWAFARRHGLANIDSLLKRSSSDPAWFWDTIVDWLGIEFYDDYETISNDIDGPMFVDWYVDGRLNIAHNTVDKHVRDGSGQDVACLWEGEDGTTRETTYADLLFESNRVANALVENGVSGRDTVGILMPSIPETAAVLYGCFKVGAIAVPMFSGFGSEAIASRLERANCSMLFTADGFNRRGFEIQLKKTASAAVRNVAGVEQVIVYDHLGLDVPWDSERDVWWSRFVGPHLQTFESRSLASDHESMLLYSSGTTGEPKGSVQTHAGQLVKAAKDVHFDFDHDPSDRFYWMTDMGWVMGPWTLIGNHALGGTVFMYEGAPDYPDPERCWRLVEDHSLTVFGTSPTAIRSLRRHGEGGVSNHDLSSLRLLGSTGEPWDVNSWLWFYDEVGDGGCPIINISGGTEIGGHFLSPLPGQPLKPCTVGQPSLGIDADIVDSNGERVPEGEDRGHLVLQASCPSMTKSLWEGNDRYLETYWSSWQGIWDHGDWAQRDEDGFWFVHGRADEVMNVAGRTVGPAEVEDALLQHDAVKEAAAVGVRDEITGEAIVTFVVVNPGVAQSEELKEALRHLVGEVLGKPYRPREISFVDDLPTNQSGKILRDILRVRAAEK